MIIWSHLAISQDYLWAKVYGHILAGTTYECLSNDISVDINGNSYSTGVFRGTVDFNPGIGNFNLTAGGGGDIYVQKLDANGDFLWVQQFGAASYEQGNSITTDNLGNVYFTGLYQQPGLGNQIIVTKLNTNGVTQWTKILGGSADERGNAIEIDNLGNVYITGQFNSLTDFDPGAGNTSLTPVGSINNYVLKLDNNGDFQWVRHYTSTSEIIGWAITLDQNNSVITTGYYNGTVDLDPSGSNQLVTSNGEYDLFISKLDQNGNTIWSQSIGGSQTERGQGIDTDNQNNIYLTGVFMTTVDFNYSVTDANNLTSQFSQDIFVLKLQTDGVFTWVKSFPSSGQSDGKSISISQNNFVYSTGYFMGTCDFDPSLSSFNLSTAGKDIYISKLDLDGNFVWAGELNGSSNFPNDGTAISNDPLGNIYVGGSYKGQIDFDPNAGNQLFNSVGTNEWTSFVVKLAPQCSNTYSTIDTTACLNYISPDGTNYSSSGTYTSTIPNSLNCDSIITINLTINQNTSSSISPSACGSYTAPDGQIYTIGGNYSAIITNAAGCDSTITINLTINQNTSSLITISECGSYIAPDGQVYNSGGNYTAVIPNNAGCDSTISINLTINPIPIISAGLDQTVCDGISVTLTGSGGAVYTWDNSIINGLSFIPPVGINEYVVSGTSVNGCIMTDTVIVTVNPLPIVSFTIDETTGCTPLVFNLTNTTLNSLNCTWDISNSDDLIGCGTVTGSIYQVGCHDITLTTTDNNGCSNSFTATNIICVEALPNASFTASPNSFSQPGEQISFTNNSSGASSYSWNFGDLSPLSTAVNPTHIFQNGVQDSFIVELIALTAFGCSDTSYLTIYNTSITDSVDTDVFIPTGFSPNNDNENDTWTVTGLEKYPNAIINVFNRWGQLLFEGGPGNSTWNGIYQGEILPTADYYFIVDLGNGTKYNGVVTLKQ